jgi:L-galactose dehydrogenase
MKNEGKVGHVGITAMPLKALRNVLDRVPAGAVDTVLSFCHYELNDTSLADMIPYLKAKGVGIINASPTGMGLLTERGAPSWHPAGWTIQDTCRRAVEFCKERGINIVELAIQFAVANPDIATTLIGSANPENMLANIRYAEGPLDQHKLAAVMEVLRPIHNFNFTRGRAENQDPIVGSS